MTKTKPQVNIFQMTGLPAETPAESTDILRCLYNLNDLEVAVFKILLGEAEKLSVQAIAKLVNKNRSTVQRALGHLQELELVAREQDLPESTNEDLKGGYCYKYTLLDPQTMELKLKLRLNEWMQRADNLVNLVRNRFEGIAL